jgi:hypothetical protein
LVTYNNNYQGRGQQNVNGRNGMRGRGATVEKEEKTYSDVDGC